MKYEIRLTSGLDAAWAAGMLAVMLRHHVLFQGVEQSNGAWLENRSSTCTYRLTKS